MILFSQCNQHFSINTHHLKNLLGKAKFKLMILLSCVHLRTLFEISESAKQQSISCESMGPAGTLSYYHTHTETDTLRSKKKHGHRKKKTNALRDKNPPAPCSIYVIVSTRSIRAAKQCSPPDQVRKRTNGMVRGGRA